LTDHFSGHVLARVLEDELELVMPESSLSISPLRNKLPIITVYPTKIVCEDTILHDTLTAEKNMGPETLAKSFSKQQQHLGSNSLTGMREKKKDRQGHTRKCQQTAGSCPISHLRLNVSQRNISRQRGQNEPGAGIECRGQQLPVSDIDTGGDSVEIQMALCHDAHAYTEAVKKRHKELRVEMLSEKRKHLLAPQVHVNKSIALEFPICKEPAKASEYRSKVTAEENDKNDNTMKQGEQKQVENTSRSSLTNSVLFKCSERQSQEVALSNLKRRVANVCEEEETFVCLQTEPRDEQICTLIYDKHERQRCRTITGPLEDGSSRSSESGHASEDSESFCGETQTDVAHCNTLQDTATRCKTLQHAATQYASEDSSPTEEMSDLRVLIFHSDTADECGHNHLTSSINVTSETLHMSSVVAGASTISSQQAVTGIRMLLSALQHTGTHCNTGAVTYCNTASRYYTLRHTTAHCKTYTPAVEHAKSCSFKTYSTPCH